MDPVVITRPEVNCETPVISENKHQLYQVSANDSGEGLPYAPEDWPNPGDKWRWKVGRRVTNGYFRDRYLYLPGHLPSYAHNSRKMCRFSSMLYFEEYVHSVFPGADVNALRNSFSWKIPSKELSNNLGCEEDPVVSGKSHLGNVICKAGNKTCCTIVEAEDTHPKFMSCNICCSEHGFCRSCCCILCSKTVDFACFGYDYIRCEAKHDGGLICGHIAHVNCGLRAYMAGTVGGSNDFLQLDAEYYCRRCDARMDLVPHVSKLLETCKTIDSHDNIEKILAVGIRLLHKSRKENAQLLLQHIYFAIAKLKGGAKLEDVWSKENISSIIPEDSYDGGINKLRSMSEEENLNAKTKAQEVSGVEFDHRVDSFIVEAEFDNAMFNLRQSQQHEYELAVEKLLAQKNLIAEWIRS